MPDIDMTGKKRGIANVIFFDQDLNMLVQERGTHSKSGEKYAFWGGGIEEGESPEQALRRELVEELNYEPKEVHYWGTYTFQINMPGSERDGLILHGELFLAPITPELLETKAEEGSAKEIMPIARAIENQNNEFGPVSMEFLRKVREDIVRILNK